MSAAGQDQELRVIRFNRGGERPALRAVEAVQVETPDGRRVALRDPMGYAEGSLILSPEAFAVAALMNGMRTVPEIQSEMARRHGALIYSDRVQTLALALEKNGFLEGPAFEAIRRRAADAYRTGETRAATHAGTAYPADPGELKEKLASFYTSAEGPGPAGPEGSGPRLAGLVAPHIDLHRGGPVYAWAYKALLEGTDADLFVVFGTAHASPRELFSLTTKAYDTPLGPMPVDRAAAEALVATLGDTLLLDELVHRTEHSIEFQALFLRSLYAGRREVTLLPILCSSLYDCADPWHDERVQRFLSALEEAVRGKKVCYIAAADLSHVGQIFGDEKGPSEQELSVLRERDQRSLSFASTSDSEGFFHDVRADMETRRICGLTPIYMTLRASGSRSGKVLRYAQWSGEGSAVTFAAVALYPPA